MIALPRLFDQKLDRFRSETKTDDFHWKPRLSINSSHDPTKFQNIIETRNSSISLSLSLAELSGSVLCLHFLGSSDSGE